MNKTTLIVTRQRDVKMAVTVTCSNNALYTIYITFYIHKILDAKSLFTFRDSVHRIYKLNAHSRDGIPPPCMQVSQSESAVQVHEGYAILVDRANLFG